MWIMSSHKQVMVFKGHFTALSGAYKLILLIATLALLANCNAKDARRSSQKEIHISEISSEFKLANMLTLEEMDEIIDKNNMQDRVSKIGYVADEMMAPLYQKAQLFVLPSLFEPFGMTTQEAMACGKAVIASKFGGIRNVITNGVDGILVDAANPQEFSEALYKLLADDDKRNAMGRAARKLIEEEYSWDAIADKFLNFYQKYY